MNQGPCDGHCLMPAAHRRLTIGVAGGSPVGPVARVECSVYPFFFLMCSHYFMSVLTLCTSNLYVKQKLQVSGVDLFFRHKLWLEASRGCDLHPMLPIMISLMISATSLSICPISGQQTCFKFITYKYKYKYSALKYEYNYEYPWLEHKYEYIF